MLKIEATAGSKEVAKAMLAVKRESLQDFSVEFGAVIEYGNFELGYKLVQYYEYKDSA